MCWNIVVFIGLTIVKKIWLFEAIWPWMKLHLTLKQ